MRKRFTFTDAIYAATNSAMEGDPNLRILGLGVTYPNGADGTMGDLGQRFPDRVLDTPVSEAAVTGLCLGAAISGIPVVLHHGRTEFALFAIDQIATQAAKWEFMFGGNATLPLTIRVALGRQWGNGPQHTQHLMGLWGGITGLTAVVPSSPAQAAKLMYWAIRAERPVVYLEPRWLYKTFEEFPDEGWKLPGDPTFPRYVQRGNEFTFLSYGEGVMEALRLDAALRATGESADVIDLVTLNPMNVDIVQNSLSKTKRLVILDFGGGSFNVASEVIGQLIRRGENLFEEPPLVISLPHAPVPTAPGQTENYYPNIASISSDFNRHFSRELDVPELDFEKLHIAPAYQFGEEE